MTKQGSEKQYSQAKQAKRMAFVSIQAGCLTFIVAGIALVVGVWLDARLGTTPRWMLILLLGSMPFTLGGVFLIVRRAMKRLKEDREKASANVGESEEKSEDRILDGGGEG